MKAIARFLMPLVLGLLSMSCGKEIVNVDYSGPVVFTKDGDTSAKKLSFTKEHILKYTEDFENASYFCAHTNSRMVDEWAMLSLYFPMVNTLKPGEELKLHAVSFLFPASSGNHRTSYVKSGKVRFMGMKDNVATLQFEDMRFEVSPFYAGDSGEYLITGTMECPIYDSFEDYKESSNQ